MNDKLEADLKDKMRERVEYMAKYWSTYSSQPGYSTFTEKTFLDDALYAIGVAFGPKYRCADGYRKFRELLRKHLDED